MKADEHTTISDWQRRFDEGRFVVVATGRTGEFVWSQVFYSRKEASRAFEFLEEQCVPARIFEDRDR
jgi:hypothetical protein